MWAMGGFEWQLPVWRCLCYWLMALPCLLICYYKAEDYPDHTVHYNGLDYNSENYIDSFTGLQQQDYFQ